MTDEVSYYEVTWRDYPQSGRVARPVAHDRSEVRRLRKSGRIEDEPRLSWAWQSPTHPPDDIVCAVDGMRLVSPLVREIFDQHRAAADEIQWIAGTVVLPSGEYLPYWIPHFPSPPDIIDRDHSDFGPSGLPMRYVLNRQRLAPHAVTIIPGRSFTFILSQTVVDALEAAGARGLLVMPRWVV